MTTPYRSKARPSEGCRVVECGLCRTPNRAHALECDVCGAQLGAIDDDDIALLREKARDHRNALALATAATLAIVVAAAALGSSALAVTTAIPIYRGARATWERRKVRAILAYAERTRAIDASGARP